MRDSIGLETGCGGIQYPLGGWLCPAQLTAAVITLAETLGLQVQYGRKVTSLAQTGAQAGSQNGFAFISFGDGLAPGVENG